MQCVDSRIIWIDKDTKVFYVFSPFQRDNRIGALVKDIYVHFIINTFLIRSKQNKKWDFFTLRDNVFTISHFLTFFTPREWLLRGIWNSYQHKASWCYQQVKKEVSFMYSKNSKGPKPDWSLWHTIETTLYLRYVVADLNSLMSII